MKVPYKWLLELAPVRATVKEITDRLTMLGIEVASIDNPGESLQGLVAADLQAVKPHPNADRLTLCQVFDGTAQHDVVCGASNMKPGDKVVWAPLGTTLPNGMKLEPKKIRGVHSDGMLCAEDELGLSEDHSGIIILDPSVKPGTPAAEALGRDEAVIEVELTANRGDCLSMIGIAREVAAAYGVEVVLPPRDIEEAPEEASSRAIIQINDADLCDRYIGRVIENVTIGPSPEWMKQRLEKCGVRSINNVVDATNYALMELGHPLHAFDLSLLARNTIIVRRARTGEVMSTLDGIERQLDPEMLVIADAEKPVALAGIMGGANSEVGNNTRTILLESAHFDPVGTRKTARKLGLSTEASYRFERGTDYDNVEYAADRCARLIAETAGGRVLQGRLDVQPNGPPRPIVLSFRPEKANRLLGSSLEGAAMKRILESLGFKVDDASPAALQVTVPPWRNDIRLEADLIEEVARVDGYNKIRGSLPRGRAVPTDGAIIPFETRLRGLLSGCGLLEVITSSFMDEQVFERLLLPPEPAVSLMNPMSSRESLMRTSLLPGLLNAAGVNQRNGRLDVMLFEVGRVFARGNRADEVLETGHTGVIYSGMAPKVWDEPERAVDFFHAKGTIETIARVASLALNWKPSDRPFLHPGRSADIYEGEKRIGYAGEIHPRVAESFDLRGSVAVAELELEPLRQAWMRRTVSFAPASIYPPAVRDLAVVVNAETRCADLEKAIQDAAKADLESVVLFDQYSGERLGEGKRSLAFRLTFRSAKGTLTDEEVNARYEKVLRALEKRYGAKLRV